MLIGDIHGDLQALNFLIRMREGINCKNILFLGDYVNRGIAGNQGAFKAFPVKN